MHHSIMRAASKFYFDYKAFVDSSLVADLGALNINGSTKDLIKHAIGFDIVSGPGVDVVIEPGNIPQQYKKIFDVVVSISSFQFCPDPILYKKQIIDLLHPRGYLFLSMCSDKCTEKHTTSNNKYGYADEFRLSRVHFESLFLDEFKILESAETNYEHPDFIIVAKLKS
jgi:hypothetical protein